MAAEFSLPSHSAFFAGYLDAVGRRYTTDQRSCLLTVSLNRPLDGLTVTNAVPVSNFVPLFEREIAHFLSTDPRDRLLFHLTEYFSWYKEFSNTCVCEKLLLEGLDTSDEYLSYRLRINAKDEVLFLARWRSNDGHA